MSMSDVYKRLASVDQGMISDCMVRLGIEGWMDGLQAVGKKAIFAGPAHTILLGPKRGGETLATSRYATIASMAKGEVLVIGGARTDENQMGDNVANWGHRYGLAAIVLDSPIRDAAAIAEVDMPVFSRGKTARMPVTTEAIAYDVAIACGGAQVRPGDIVVGSDDGLLVIPPSRLDDLLYQLEDMESIEAAIGALIRDGAPLAEVEKVVKGKKKLRVSAAA